MEFLTPIDKWMQNNNITVENALDIGIGVADALDICHKNGIIHRDIKLSNIFVSKDGVFKIGDFGVSKNINNATMAKTIKGTPNYIAPEVYIGKSKYDSSVDNYSLGILLYYLFNKLRFPYYPNFPNEYTQEDSDKAFYKRMNYEKLEAPVCAPLSVANIIKKAISTPSERYIKAKDMSKDLSDVKTNLTKDELKVKIGFEPKAITDEWIENDKERKLVQDLNGESQSDVSFIEQGITVFEKRDESKVNKNKKYVIVGLVMVGIIVVIIFAKNVMNDRHSKEKLPSQIQTSEFVNENNTNISEGKEDVNEDGNDVNADGTGDGINAVENDSNTNVNQSGSIIGKDNNLNQNNSDNNQIGESENIETTKKVKRKQPETTKRQQEITTKKQQQATTQKHYNSTPKPTQKPTEKKEDNFDFKSVVE